MLFAWYSFRADSESLSRIRSGVGTYSRMGHICLIRSSSRAAKKANSLNSTAPRNSKIETRNSLRLRISFETLKILKISKLKPKVCFAKQTLVGIKISNKNLLEEHQTIRTGLAILLQPGVPILVLKEVEISMKSLKTKIHFCLASEEFWLVFR